MVENVVIMADSQEGQWPIFLVEQNCKIKGKFIESVELLS
jgi:hypothetical protein